MAIVVAVGREAAEEIGAPGVRALRGLGFLAALPSRHDVALLVVSSIRKGRGLKKASDLGEEYRVTERAKQVRDLAWERAQGEAWEKRNKAILDEAKAEDVRTDTELKKRSLEATVRKVEAEANLLEKQPMKTEAEAFKTLIQALKESGIAFRVAEDGTVQVLRSGDAPALLESDAAEAEPSDD